jgi:spore maturation protein A
MILEFMLNYLWGIMIIIGIIYAAITGNMAAVADGALNSSKEAVTLCITMLGVMSLWTGLMEIAKKSGLIDKCTRLIQPIMKWLFPGVPEDHEAMAHMTTNMIANFFGLGWAATPAGIRAMKSLAELNKHSKTASYDMCVFLVINISSVQLIPINIIAYRSQYGSVNPTVITAPAIIATTINTVAAVVFCRLIKYFEKKNGV